MDTQVIHEALKMVKLGQEHGFTPKRGAYYHYARSFYLKGWRHNLLHSIYWALRIGVYGGIIYALIKLLAA